MAETPVLVCLHALGASGRSFDAVAAQLRGQFEVLALDLPGFGDEPVETGTAVEDMADHVVDRIREHLAGRQRRWLLVGHSMGGKIASVVAARTLAGTAPLFGLAGVVLLAASPPSPEPMPAEKRAEMTAWALGGPLDEAAARSFIDANVGSPLPPDVDAVVLADLQRCSPEAWRAWLQRGSREDWSGNVGRLELPALIIAGDADGPLGPDGQRAANGPVYPLATWVELPGAGHLLPHERPAEVAGAIAAFWNGRAGLGPVVPGAVAATIAGPHTSARTRSALAARALADDPGYAPQALTRAQLETLRGVAERVVPQDGPPIDLAARVDAQLAAGAGNGWRFADAPPDVEAYRLALDALAGTTLEDTTLEDADPHWLEDACDDLVRAWLAHPASLAKIGFDGYAGGGDGPRLQGFTLLDIGVREAWEPVS